MAKSITAASILLALTTCLTLSNCTRSQAEDPTPKSEQKQTPKNQPQKSALLPETHYDFLDSYCLTCHDRDTEKGGVNLEDLAFEISSDIPTAEAWQKVLNVINSGEMPPEDKKQPKDGEKTRFLSDLSNQLVVARAVLSDSGGKITMRRLNRREYQHTIRDLLGVHVNVDDLPDDTVNEGFDTAGASLFFSSDQFERYLEIAEKAVAEASSQKWKNRKTTTHVFQPEKQMLPRMKNQYEKFLERKRHIDKRLANPDKPATDFGFIDDDRVKFELGVHNRQFPFMDHYYNHKLSQTGFLLGTNFSGALTLPVTLGEKAHPGRYKLKVTHAPLITPRDSDRFIELGRPLKDAQGGEMEVLDYRAAWGTPQKPGTTIFEVDIPVKGPRTYLLRTRQINNRDAMRYHFDTKKRENKIGPLPTTWIESVEWEGPLDLDRPTPIADILQPYQPKVWQHTPEVLTDFYRHVCRGREPSPTFIEKLTAIIDQKTTEKNGAYPDALRHAFAIILSSPGFLYISEPAEQDHSHKLTDLELANRLSYFLWSAPPDQKLLTLAKNNKLSKPETLRQQTTRLLNDPRARDFVDGLAHQWLHMKRLDFFQFNPRKYHDFDDSLKNSAREEIYQTILHLVRNQLPLTNLLNSDEIVINDILARYYEIPGVKGKNFRPVPVPKDNPRGGLLATAAVLAMGSDGERSSPVERGVWVMRHLLHKPPPPAPANVPQLSRITDPHTPARDLIKLHQEEPQCAQCHRKIDPIGYGMENFNAAGKWRSEEITEENVRRYVPKKTKSHPIDPTGTLPDGTPFTDFYELREKIAERRGPFARSYTEALIAFGLGRPYGFTDQDLADEIIAKAKKRNYAADAFIHALIQSEPFQTK